MRTLLAIVIMRRLWRLILATEAEPKYGTLAQKFNVLSLIPTALGVQVDIPREIGQEFLRRRALQQGEST